MTLQANGNQKQWMKDCRKQIVELCPEISGIIKNIKYHILKRKTTKVKLLGE